MTERSYPIRADWDTDWVVEQLAISMAHRRTPSAREDARACLGTLAALGFKITAPGEAEMIENARNLRRDKSDPLTEALLRNHQKRP